MNALTPASQAGTRYTYPGRIEGWVDLGGWSRTEIAYLPADSHTSTYYTDPGIGQLCVSRTDEKSLKAFRRTRVNH